MAVKFKTKAAPKPAPKAGSKAKTEAKTEAKPTTTSSGAASHAKPKPHKTSQFGAFSEQLNALSRGEGKKKVTSGAKAKTEAATASGPKTSAKPASKSADSGTTAKKPLPNGVRAFGELGLDTPTKNAMKMAHSKGDRAKYESIAKKAGMSDAEIGHYYDTLTSYAERDKAKSASKPASGSKPSSGPKSASGTPSKASVTSGAKAKTEGKKPSTAGSKFNWSEFNKGDKAAEYHDLIRRSIGGDKTARGILFNGTANGGKNKFGMDHATLTRSLSYLENNPEALANRPTAGKAGKTSSGKKQASGSFDVNAPLDVKSRLTGYADAVAERAAKAKGNVGIFGTMTPGGLTAHAYKALADKPTALGVQKVKTGVNTGVLAALVADQGFDAYGQATGQQAGEANYLGLLNPLVWANAVSAGAGRKAGSKSYPAAELTDAAKTTLAQRDQFVKVLADASRSIDPATGKPTSRQTFDTAFNLVQAKYQEAVARANALPDTDAYKASALKSASDTAIRQLGALSANKNAMAAKYAAGDIAAVNKAIQALPEVKRGDLEFTPYESFDLYAPGDVDSYGKEGAAIIDRAYNETMSAREKMGPLDRLGW